MLHWFRRILPRQLMFFPLFERHAAVVVDAAKALREMLAGHGQLPASCQEIIAREHEADEIAREVLIGLRTTFITPFDRADIQSLITSMDNSVDQMQQTAKAIMLFEMTSFDSEMQDMTEAIVECAELVQRAVSMLLDVANNAADINETCLKITRIEGDADDCMIKGLRICINGPKQEIQWTLFAATRFTDAPGKYGSTGWRTLRMKFRALSSSMRDGNGALP